MKSVLWLLAVFAAAVAVVIVGRFDAGYVVFVQPPYRVEVSTLFFAIAAFVLFASLYALLRLLGQTAALPGAVRAFRLRRRRERAHAALASALQAYYEGRYARVGYAVLIFFIYINLMIAGKTWTYLAKTLWYLPGTICSNRCRHI